MSSVHRLSIVAALAAPLLALPAHAQEEASVAILPYAPLFGEVPQSTGDRASEFVTKELSATKGFKVVAVSEGKGKAAEKKGGEEEIEAAKKEIEAATAAFEKAHGLANGKPPRMKPAADLYEKSIQQFLANFHGAESFKPLSDAYVQLAIARIKLANEEEAIKLLDDVVRIDPDRILAPPEVANLFAKFHEKARKAYFAKGRGQIRVNSTPAGARVMLDGRELGETPLLAKEVLPGEHYVRVLKPGSGAFWKKITVVAGEEVTLSANLAGEATGPLATLARTLSENAVDESVVKTATDLGRASKAEYVLFGAMRKEDENFSVKTYALRVKDSTIAELTALAFDVEMLGAAIEVFKLASDFGEKVKDFPGVALPGKLELFPGVAPAGGGEDAVAVVRVSPGDGSGPAKAGEGEEVATGGRRPVKRVIQPVEERKPIEEEKKAEVEQPDEESAIVKRPTRVRTRIGEEPAPVKKEEPKDAEPEITLKSDPKKDDVIGEMLEAEREEEKKKKEEAAKKVDLELKQKAKGDRVADLSPEELARLEDAEKGASSGTGKVLMYTGIGVGAAALVGTGAYFLFFSPSTPTSATAHISWQP